MATTCILNQPITLSFAVSDDHGEAIAFETPPQWVWNDKMANVVPANDGMSAKVVGHVPGWTQLLIDAQVPSGALAGHSTLVALVDLLILDNENPWDTVRSQAIFTVRDTKFTRKLQLIEEVPTK